MEWINEWATLIFLGNLVHGLQGNLHRFIHHDPAGRNHLTSFQAEIDL